jgi:hypothetical protein
MRNSLIATTMVLLMTTISLSGESVKKKEVSPSAKSFTGKVVPLATLLKKQGIAFDADSTKDSLALETEDGTIYQLVKNDASRKFFLDTELLNRPMRLTGKLVKGSQILQVEKVQSIWDGKLHEVYYWCEKCQLRAEELGLCKCCGGPTVLYETPLGNDE